jgi:hypothetical protein
VLRADGIGHQLLGPDWADPLGLGNAAGEPGAVQPVSELRTPATRSATHHGSASGLPGLIAAVVVLLIGVIVMTGSAICIRACVRGIRRRYQRRMGSKP